MPASGAQDHLFIQGEACDDSSTNDIVINGKQSTRPFIPNSNGGKIQDLLIIFLSFPTIPGLRHHVQRTGNAKLFSKHVSQFDMLSAQTVDFTPSF